MTTPILMGIVYFPVLTPPLDFHIVDQQESTPEFIPVMMKRGIG